MKTKLKKLRVAAGMTQEEVASELNIAQSTYQRWEQGKTKIPQAKKTDLCKVLGVSEVELDGGKAPFDLFGVDRRIDDEHKYFGEVAIHFSSGANLLLPITYAEANSVANQMSDDSEENTFMVVAGLNNSIVLVRRDSIDDVYLSIDAADRYGPETYDQELIIEPDDDTWHIIENSEDTDFVDEDVDEKLVAEVMGLLMPGESNPLDDHVEKVERDNRTLLLSLASHTVIKYSSGKERVLNIVEDLAVYEAFVLEVIQTDPLQGAMCIPCDSEGQDVFVRRNSLDYIRFPKHKYNRGELETMARELD